MKTIDINEAVSKLRPKKQVWFKYFFPDLSMSGEKTTLEETMRKTGIHSEFPLRRWKQTNEFKALVSLYLYSKQADDLLKMYETVKKNAIETGDEKAVKLMLSLQKEIALQQKASCQYFTAKVADTSDPIDDLD